MKVQFLFPVFLNAFNALASAPYPSDAATDVPSDVVLRWTPGEYAIPVSGHKVYLSENFSCLSS